MVVEGSTSSSPQSPTGVANTLVQVQASVEKSTSTSTSTPQSTVTTPTGSCSVISGLKAEEMDRRSLIITPPPPSPIPGQIVPTYSPGPIEFGNTFRLIPRSDQIVELQTIIRDKNTTRSDFKFYADRLIRLVIEESLNQLPFKPVTIVTPTGSNYEGLKYDKGNCGVSIVRSGEAMEQGLRDCCRSIRIGKILVESDLDTHEAHVVYARFPEDISDRKVILMYPIMSSGNTVIKAVNVLREHLVREGNIILANLFCTPYAVKSVLNAFPQMKILTSEVHPVAPNHFGQRYFGTD